MRGNGKHSKKLLFVAMACILCGCQEKEDMATETGTEAEIGSPWESVNEDVQNVTENEDNVPTVHTDAETDFEMENSMSGDHGQGSFGSGSVNLDSDMTENDIFLTNAEDVFYHTALPEEIRERITGKSYPDTEESLQISYEDLAYVHVLHYDFQMQVQEGELICNRAIAQDLVDAFYELYENQYPIEKIRLIDEYDADDEASMADNNTSCFNYRTVPGRTKLSNHAYGYAIDINPLYNPYVRTRDGQTLISPDNAVPYADRSADFAHKIDRDDLCYRIFVEHGFDWGGAWNSSKDYQHFEKVP